MEERACGGREGDETRGKESGRVGAREGSARRNMAGESREIGARRRNLVSPLSLASAETLRTLCAVNSPPAPRAPAPCRPPSTAALELGWMAGARKARGKKRGQSWSERAQQPGKRNNLRAVLTFLV